MYRGEEKGFRCQFRAKRDGIQSPKDAARSGKNPVCGRRGKGCRRQSIQRLLRGGSMPFRGLRKPPALPEGLTLLFGQCGARRTARCSFRHIAERRPLRTGGGRPSAAGVRRAHAGAAVQRRKTGRAGRGQRRLRLAFVTGMRPFLRRAGRPAALPSRVPHIGVQAAYGQNGFVEILAVHRHADGHVRRLPLRLAVCDVDPCFV